MTELKPSTQKVLESGLVDRSMIELLEKWGNLPHGASDLVKEDALKDVTKDHLYQLANELGAEVEKEHVLRETYLDLERIRWPTVVSIFAGPSIESNLLVDKLAAVMDRMGRYYFRIQDVKDIWFVPGYVLHRKVDSENEKVETITEKQVLYVNEQPVCIQVSTMGT